MKHHITAAAVVVGIASTAAGVTATASSGVETEAALTSSAMPAAAAAVRAPVERADRSMQRQPLKPLRLHETGYATGTAAGAMANIAVAKKATARIRRAQRIATAHKAYEQRVAKVLAARRARAERLAVAHANYERRVAAVLAARRAAAAHKAAEQAAAHRAAAHPVPAPVAPGGSLKGYAESLVGAAQFGCLDQLWDRESGWSVTASNPSSGAYGIPQALPGSKMASAGADWQTNGYTQIRWGLSYIRASYGTPCAAWAHSQAYGWY